MDKKHLFSWLLNKAISMALWTKARLCGKSSLLEQSLPRTQSRPIRSLPIYQVSLWSLPTYKVGPRNLRNLRLKNSCLYSLYLCAFLWLKIHLIYAIRSTKDYVRNYKLFLQNEPKFPKVKLNVNQVITRNYGLMDTWSIGKNEPKTNPNEPKTNPNS
jgi:hypothetical protein